MKTISFGSLKGGTGKSSLALLAARRLASAGKKVLAVDFDINNSTSFVLTPENLPELDPQNRKHIAAALQSENLLDYVIPSKIENIDLLRSSLYLVDLRTISTNRFKNLLKEIPNDRYDYVIIDTAPTYDNLVLSAYEGSDIIVTPTLLNQFDFNTTHFLSGKLRTETSVFENWKIVFNQWTYTCDNPNSAESDYINLFGAYFNNIMAAHLPFTRLIKSAIDRQELITSAHKFERLKNSINAFVSELTGISFENIEGGF